MPIFQTACWGPLGEQLHTWLENVRTIDGCAGEDRSIERFIQSFFYFIFCLDSARDRLGQPPSGNDAVQKSAKSSLWRFFRFERCFLCAGLFVQRAFSQRRQGTDRLRSLRAGKPGETDAPYGAKPDLRFGPCLFTRGLCLALADS